MKKLPIETAPRDGTYIFLIGKSGYRGTPWRVEVGRWLEGYRDFWINHANDAFSDGGDEPEFWSPLPEDWDK